MSTSNSSSSATGNPRNKTALAPGKSLMDWVRLCNSGKDISGTGGSVLSVSREQLALHNKKTDAWIAIGGIVYNITEYMSFHPGGEEELMRGVGIDATKLFNQIHPWVNYESLLKACIIGRLENNVTPINSSTWIESDRVLNLNSKLTAASISKISSVNDETNKIVFKMDWFQQTASLSLIFYFKINSIDIKSPFQVSVFLKQKKHLMICFEQETDLYELEEDVRWPCSLKIHQTIIEIKLMKELPKLWKSYGNKLKENVNMDEFFRMKVVHVSDLTHDTKLIGLKYEDTVLHYMHIGHHVQLKKNVEGNEKIRSYTPVSFLVNSGSNKFDASLFFVIKNYGCGKLSHILCSSKISDIIEMSRPKGTFNMMVLRNRQKLILFAAGTGLTPMTSLIIWTLRSTRLNISLTYFNKAEIDIIWENDMNKLTTETTRFQVTYVLSQPSSCWTGRTGLIDQNIVKSCITNSIEESYVCICGPSEFNKLCINYVTECGFKENDYHCFSG